MPSFAMKAGALALACLGTASANVYTLDSSDNYEGQGFFDMFQFFTDPDPTAGYVSYQSESSARSMNLISYDSTNQGSYMGVDYNSVLDKNGKGRASVRIQTKKQYTHGLFIADLAHMPASVCGTWPAL